MGTPTVVGPQDTIVLHVSGVKSAGELGRGGLPTTIASGTHNLRDFLDLWGGGGPKKEVKVDMAALSEAFASGGAATLEAKLAEIGEAVAGAGVVGGALPDRIQEAVFNYLKTEKDVLVSDKDPGVDQWYVNPADFKYICQQHPADGMQWFVSLAAPFG
jgi:hypothetical protein